MPYIIAGLLLTLVFLCPALVLTVLVLGFCAAAFVAAWHVGKMLWDMGGSALWDGIKGLWSGSELEAARVDLEAARDSDLDSGSDLGSDVEGHVSHSLSG